MDCLGAMDVYISARRNSADQLDFRRDEIENVCNSEIYSAITLLDEPILVSKGDWPVKATDKDRGVIRRGAWGREW